MAKIKQFIKIVGIFVTLFLVFQYVADFSLRQSFCLAMLALIGYSFYDSVDADRKFLIDRFEATRHFTPHWVSMRPNWPELLLDFNLIADKDEEEFRHLCEEQDFGGVYFVVLQRRCNADRPALVN